jgi:hypothetical protein
MCKPAPGAGYRNPLRRSPNLGSAPNRPVGRDSRRRGFANRPVSPRANCPPVGARRRLAPGCVSHLTDYQSSNYWAGTPGHAAAASPAPFRQAKPAVTPPLLGPRAPVVADARADCEIQSHRQRPPAPAPRLDALQGGLISVQLPPAERRSRSVSAGLALASFSAEEPSPSTDIARQARRTRSGQQGGVPARPPEPGLASGTCPARPTPSRLPQEKHLLGESTAPEDLYTPQRRASVFAWQTHMS